MAAPTRNVSAGGKYNFIGFYNSNDFLIGGNTTGASAGSSSGFALLEGLKTASPATPAPEVVQITGDDALLGEFSFDSIEQRTFVADYAVRSSDIEASLLGTTARSVAGGRWLAADIKNAPQRTVAIIFNARAKSMDSGSAGGGRWESKIILAASATPLGRTAYTEREGAVYQLSISPQLAAYDLLGVTIVSSIHGTDGMRYDTVTSDYPIHAQVIQGNASQTTFSLDYTPISTSNMVAYVNRAAATVNSISTTAKTATLSAAPASGAYGIIIYQFSG